MSLGQKLADPVSLSLSFREVEDVVAYATDDGPADSDQIF